MSEIILALQSLYKVLKASKAGEHFVKIEWENWPTTLSIRNSWGGERNDHIVHITLGEESGKFNYQAISNKGMNNSEEYLTVEERKKVSQAVLLEVAYRLLTPQD